MQEAKSKIEEYNYKASQIYVRIGEDYVNALKLIETFNDTNVRDIKPEDASRRFQDNLLNKNIRATVRSLERSPDPSSK